MISHNHPGLNILKKKVASDATAASTDENVASQDASTGKDGGVHGKLESAPKIFTSRCFITELKLALSWSPRKFLPNEVLAT